MSTQVMKAFIRASTSKSRCELLVKQGTHLGPATPRLGRCTDSTDLMERSVNRNRVVQRTALQFHRWPLQSPNSATQQAYHNTQHRSTLQMWQPTSLSTVPALQSADGNQRHMCGRGSCLAALYLLGATGSIGQLAFKPLKVASVWPTPCPNLLTQDNADCAQTLCTKTKPPFMSFSATTASFSGTHRCAAPLPLAPVHPAACCSHRNAESQQAKERQQECSPFVSCGDVQLKVNLLHIHMHRDEVSWVSLAMAMQG